MSGCFHPHLFWKRYFNNRVQYIRPFRHRRFVGLRAIFNLRPGRLLPRPFEQLVPKSEIHSFPLTVCAVPQKLYSKITFGGVQY